MSRTIELSGSEMPRALPPPNFSEPFAAPSLRWACKKRLRCVHPDAPALCLGSSTAEARTAAAPPLVCNDGGWLPERGVAAAPRSPSPPIRRPAPSPAPAVESPDLAGGDGGGGGEGLGWSLRSRRGALGRGAAEEGKETRRRKVELWVSLSKDEIDRDFLLLTGSKPHRRPRSRPKPGSAHLLKGIFPGSCLPNVVAADLYKVSAGPSDSRKR